jgi:RNA polymerase sigma factor for flagellar operon FliA
MMQRQPVTDVERDRILGSLSFVESLARRVASSMPHSIDLGDLVQDGMLGLIDAAHRFDESRGIKFETFAERRVRGAMIDALRKDAWPRGVRRMRRELETAREELRRELGCEPSLSDLAARVGTDEARLERTIVRISTIESTSPLLASEHADEGQLPRALQPAETPLPDQLYAHQEVRDRVRTAIRTLPPREQRVIGMYYFGEVTMKEIGAEIGVNESRVSQLHARAVQRLRKVLAASDGGPDQTAEILPFVAPQGRKALAHASLHAGEHQALAPRSAPGVVVPYASTSRTVRSSSDRRKGLASQRQPLSSRNRSASVPATSPVTKITRRASAGVAAAIAR